MEIVESYVHEVTRFIPDEQRQDVAEDLLGSILGEIDGLAEAQNRAPSDDDAMAVLKGFGHPLKVAGRYQQERYLIGPEIYPVFRQTLRTVLSVVFVGIIVAGLTLGLLNDWTLGPWSLFWTAVEVLFWVVGVVFLVFAAIEYSGEKLNLYDGWTPTSLSSKTIGVIDRGDIITNLLSEGFFLLWWNNVVVLQNFMPDSTFVITLAPIWADYFWSFNVLFGVCFALHGYALVLGVWRRWALLFETVAYTALIALGLVLIGTQELIMVTGELGEKLANHPRFDLQIIVKVTLGFVILVTLWDILKTYKIWRGRS